MTMTSHIAKLLAAATGESDALLGMVQRFRENFTEYAHTHRAVTENCEAEDCGGYFVQVANGAEVIWVHGPTNGDICLNTKKDNEKS
jgi:hypothetical protein